MKLRPTAKVVGAVLPPAPLAPTIGEIAISTAKAAQTTAMDANAKIMAELLPKATIPMLVAEMQKCAKSSKGTPNARLERMLLGEAAKRLVDLGTDLMMALNGKHALRMHRMEIRRQILAGEISAREALALADAEHDAFLQGLMYENEIDGVRFWLHEETGLSYATMPGDTLDGDCLKDFIEVKRKTAAQSSLF